jgi:hypothetical protein
LTVAIIEPRALLRLQISDTDVNDQLFNDEELDAFLTIAGADVRLAAIECCKALAARFSRRATLTLSSGGDTVKRDYSRMAESYTTLAETLKNQGMPGSVPMVTNRLASHVGPEAP